MAHRWIIRDQVYYSRLQAARVSDNKLPVKFLLHRGEQYDKIDWTVEPAQPWPAMLAKRARQIRDSFRYVRLWYSGGADSHTMLKAFVDNKIWPDEITCVRYSLIDSFKEGINVEVNNAAIVYLDSIKNVLNVLPKTVKINIVDIGSEDHLNYYKSQYAGDYVREDDSMTSLKLMHSDWILVKPELFDGDFTTRAEVTGQEKAKPYYYQGKWYIDLSDASLAVNEIHKDIPSEPFFTTPDYPELHCKQAHMVKAFLKQRFPDRNYEQVVPYYNRLFQGDYGVHHLDTIAERTALFGASRNTDTQRHSIGKSTDADGVKIWDSLMRLHAGETNQIVKLYDNIMTEHKDTLFKFNGMFGNIAGKTNIYRKYCIGK